MDAPVLMVFRWVGVSGMILALSVCAWAFIASRRSDRPLQPMLSAQVILLLGGVILGVSGAVGGSARLVMAWLGGMLVAFAGGRMWDPFKHHLKEVGWVKADDPTDAKRRD